MPSSNPLLQPKSFSKNEYFSKTGTFEKGMTVEGTVNKTGILLTLLVVSAGWVWWFSYNNPSVIMPYMLIGIIGGFIALLITMFKKDIAPVTAPIYAILEGFAIGGISTLFEGQYPGIVTQAVCLTFTTMFAMLFLYKFNVIRVTDNFRRGVIAATMGIALVYVFGFILSLFHVPTGFIFGGGVIGIGFSIFVIIIAAFNLVLDFDFIEKSATHSLPKYMEWFAAVGLMVTLVWLYLEFLRLLSKLRER
ncbi:MAG: Bax inhibitor-1/YccA family protein [Candidatus Margulisiibacteriota bacterium]|jgi:uncharacterized YccA/Bax inhibitor family protein